MPTDFRMNIRKRGTKTLFVTNNMSSAGNSKNDVRIYIYICFA